VIVGDEISRLVELIVGRPLAVLLNVGLALTVSSPSFGAAASGRGRLGLFAAEEVVPASNERSAYARAATPTEDETAFCSHRAQTPFWR